MEMGAINGFTGNIQDPPLRYKVEDINVSPGTLEQSRLRQLGVHEKGLLIV